MQTYIIGCKKFNDYFQRGKDIDGVVHVDGGVVHLDGVDHAEGIA